MDDDVLNELFGVVADMLVRLDRLEEAMAVLLEERERKLPGRRFDHLLTDDQRLQIAAVQQRVRDRKGSDV